jgi:hypothetical protein
MKGWVRNEQVDKGEHGAFRVLFRRKDRRARCPARHGGEAGPADGDSIPGRKGVSVHYSGAWKVWDMQHIW